jgi:hypothetical protein
MRFNAVALYNPQHFHPLGKPKQLVGNELTLVFEPPQNRLAATATATDAIAALRTYTPDSYTLTITRIAAPHPNRTRVSPYQQLGRAQHRLARRQERAFHPDLHAAATKGRLGKSQQQIERVCHCLSTRALT